MGKSVITPNHVYTKLGNGTIRDLTLDTNTVYTHPSTKQCTGGNCDTVNGYSITAQTTDPGAGSSLASGRIVLVYE